MTDTANDDFTLQSGSPAINIGTTVAIATPDFAGTVRPQGPAYDVGAYEFLSGVPDFIPNGMINSVSITNGGFIPNGVINSVLVSASVIPNGSINSVSITNGGFIPNGTINSVTIE